MSSISNSSVPPPTASSIQSMIEPPSSNFTSPAFSHQTFTASPETSFRGGPVLSPEIMPSSGNGSSTPQGPAHVDPLPPRTKTERFLLTAADQDEGSRKERLASVIRAKYEAGLLKPYNHVKGYARLGRWMEHQYVPGSLLFRDDESNLHVYGSVSSDSKQAILQPISVLRPKFRVRP